MGGDPEGISKEEEMKHKSIGAIVGAITALSIGAVPAMAEYPVSTVRLITHSSPGGGTDVFLRKIATTLGPIMDVNFVVENVTGGGGAKAMAEVAAAPKDGSVFYGSTPSYIITSLLSKPEVGYDQLDPIVNMFYDPQTVFVKSDSPYQNLQDIIKDAQASPGAVVAAVSTPSSLDRQVMEEFQAITDTQLVTLTHDGGGDVLMSVLNGTAAVGIGEIAEMRGQLDADAMRVIATYTEERVPGFDDVPTAQEQGVDLVVAKFRGIVGPKDLPPEVITAWEEGVQEMMADPEFREWYEQEGVQYGYLGHDDANAAREEFVASQTEFFEKFDIN